MIVLAIDGALGGFSAAVARDGALSAAIEAPGNVALEQGLNVIRQVLEASGLRGSDLDRIAVGAGPGSFTGLRIAISYAKTLALAWDKPLVAITSFDAIEAGIPTVEPRLAVVRGRSGVISARLAYDGRSSRASGWIADVLDELLLDGPPEPLHVAGAAEDVLRALAERGLHVNAYDPAVSPAAAAIAALAAQRTPAASVHEVRADYGELPAARVPKFT